MTTSSVTVLGKCTHGRVDADISSPMVIHKVVIVGPGVVDKTCFAMRTVGGSFRTDGLIEAIKPTSIRALCLNSLMDMVIHEAPTASEPNPLHGMQAVACRDACVGAVCCDVTLPDSLEYLERFCAPRAMEYTMNAPIIVVGTKSALEKPISIDEARKVTGRVNTVHLLEYSSRINDGMPAKES